MARKYLVETFGCQMNFHDGERMSGLLEREGYEPATSEADADVIVINTCSVRERAEEKLYTRLGEIREVSATRLAPPIVAVAGCVAQQDGPAILARDRSADVIVGTQAVTRLPALIEEARARRQPMVSPDMWGETMTPGRSHRGESIPRGSCATTAR